MSMVAYVIKCSSLYKSRRRFLEVVLWVRSIRVEGGVQIKYCARSLSGQSCRIRRDIRDFLRF